MSKRTMQPIHRQFGRTSDRIIHFPAQRRIKLIHEHVRKIKASEKMGVKYTQLWEEKALIREEGRSEGRSEGRQIRT